MPFDFTAGIVRILLGPQKGTAGTGFVLNNKGLIATCAHVVEDAHAGPGDAVSLIFYAAKDKGEQLATVLPEYWRASNTEDIAFLLLREGEVPETVQPLRLTYCSGKHRFSTFGFPAQAPRDGRQGAGLVYGLPYEMEGFARLQLWSQETTKGFSGAPVWDDELQAVIGMVIGIGKGRSIKWDKQELYFPSDSHGRFPYLAFATPTEALYNSCDILKPSDICPYRGLDTFTADNVNIFFGREEAIKILARKLKGHPDFLAVFGPSGSGKSSLVQAGLIPRLRERLILSEQFGVITTRPSTDPFKQLAEKGLIVEPGKPNSLATGIREWLKQNEKKRFVLVIDQFEELFVTCSKPLQKDFVMQLTGIRNADHLLTTVIIVMRNDFYTQFVKLESLEEWMQESGGPINIPIKLKREDLIAIIQNPAGQHRLHFQENLSELIIRDVMKESVLPSDEEEQVAQSTVLPLLEFTLTELWQHRENGMLTNKAYKDIDGVAGSITRWADEVISQFEKAKLPLVKSIFLALIHLGDENRGYPDSRKPTSRISLMSLYQNESERVSIQNIIDNLTDARLLVADRQGDEETIEIIHDALLRHWRQLKQWIADNRPFLAWHQKFEKRFKEWEQTNADHSQKREKHKLLAGSDLVEAEDWLKKREADLHPYEEDFINISRKRQRWEQNRVIAALGVFLAIASVLATIAGLSYFRAEKELQIAQSQGLATQAQNSMLKNQFDLALLLSVKAYQTNNNYETRDTLLTTLENSSHINKILHNYTDFAFSSDGRTILSSRSNGTITLWDLATGKSRSSLIPIQKGCQGVRLDPDGKKAASLCPYGVGLWDIKTGRQLAKLSLKEIDQTFDQRKILTFSLDGHLLAAYDGNGNIVVWNLDSGKTLGSPLSAYDPTIANYYMNAMPTVFSPDGKLLASSLCWTQPSSAPHCNNSYQDQPIFIWDIASGKRISTIHMGHLGVLSLAFSPNAQLLAAGGVNGTIALWNLQTKQPLGSPLVGHTGWVESLAFSPDGKKLVSGGTDKTVRFWNVATQQNTGDPWLGHQGSVSAVLFSPDGQRLVSGDSDNTLIIWNLTPDTPIKHHVCSGMRYLPGMGQNDSSRYLVGSDDKRGSMLCDVATGTYSSLPTISPDTTMVFSPDGRVLASYSNEADTITLWDLATGDRIGQPLRDRSGVYPLVFSPDGRILASISHDGTILLWDTTEQRLSNRPPIKPSSHPFSGITGEFSPDGKLLALEDNYDAYQNDSSFTITLWDTITGQTRLQFRGLGTVEALEFSPDGRMMALWGSDKTFTLWDLATGERIDRPLRDGGVYPLAFSPDGRTLVSMSHDGTILLWDTTEQKLSSRLPIKLSSYFTPSSGVEFSPDGKLLAVVSADSTISLWDMTRQEPFTHPLLPLGPDPSSDVNLLGDPGGIGSIMFGSNWQLAATSYYGPQSYITERTLWNINITSWIAYACSIANRNLTPAEWEQFVGQEPYQRVCPDLP